VATSHETHNRDGGEPLPNELSELIEAVYAELRVIAAAHLRHERRDHTLQTTALVNEAYLRLRSQRAELANDRAAFFAAAAEAIRRILTDHARRRRRIKRGGAALRLELDNCPVPATERTVDVVELDEALRKLAGESPRAARIVELRYFAGLSEHEVADVLGVSRRTVQCDWRWARAWLMRALT
jgi:RNA polymerase sigma-70 factor, ECF subfamily